MQGRASRVCLHAAQDTTEKVLVYPNEDSKDAVTLTKADVRRLRTDDFLNDSLVDFQLKKASLFPPSPAPPSPALS